VSASPKVSPHSPARRRDEFTGAHPTGDTRAGASVK
jgi:hypothetical protein